MLKIKTMSDLKQVQAKGRKALYPPEIKIVVGMATCGMSVGAGVVYEAISDLAKKSELDIVVSKVGCKGWCSKEPLVDVLHPGVGRLSYGEMTPEKALKLMKALEENNIENELILCRTKEEDCFVEDKKVRYGETSRELEGIPFCGETGFFRKQQKIAMRNSGFIDPESIEEYIAKGGYFSLFKAITKMSSEEIIEEVTKSGLRGRGGAGFPTGQKWELTRKSEGDFKVVICNADEGNPGTYMDRTLLEGDPHSILEGMAIGAFAIGANEGYIYIRREYPLAIKRLAKAIKQAEEYGCLGQKILDSGLNFTIRFNEGAGAFVCGEETALIASIEGKAGEPRLRPPFPSQSGLWGKPTSVNNVETWSNIPAIVAQGGDWFARIGVGESRGTKVFSLVGKTINTGLVEVPMGTTLREMIFDIGGGIRGGKKLKAVQIGGPAGGCVPEEHLDIHIDYEELKDLGVSMGSGGMIVMDEDTCMVDIARHFAHFLEYESCGRCTSCREGLKRMEQVLTGIIEGRGKEGDIKILEDLSSMVKDVSLCGLGQTAPNTVLTTIRFFRDEYGAHIREKRCPAGVCKNLGH
ncbi:MAG: NuoF family protein [Pseudomonadota bacterium]